MFRFPIKAAVILLFGHIHVVKCAENPLYDCVLHMIRERFPEDCVCFYLDASNHSLMIGNLIREIGELRAVYVVSPKHDQVLVSMNKTRPTKPFPCYFIIDLPVGSNVTRSFLTGSYHQGDYNWTESRYMIVAEEHLSYRGVVDVLREMFMYGFLDVDIVVPNGPRIDIFTYFPFGKKYDSCPETSLPVLEKVAVWSDGTLHEAMPLFPEKLPSGMFAGCSWNISCAYFTPYVMVDGGGRFTGPMPGYDASPLSLVFERLNLTPEWSIDIEHFWMEDHGNGSYSGAVSDLMLGRGTQMCCGGLYQTTWASTNLDPTSFHTWATMAWFVAAPDKIPKWIMIFEALSISVWIRVIATCIIVPVIYWIFCILTKNQGSLGQVYMKFTALGLGNSAGSSSAKLTLRIILICWFFYAFHIDQFYLASLTGLITTAEYEPTVKTVDDLLAKNLPTAGFEYTFKELNQSSDPNVLMLIKNQVPIEVIIDAKVAEMSQFKNFSIVDNTVFIRYTVSRLPNASIYQTQVSYKELTMSALMWRHNYLFPRIDWLLLRMFDAGFPVYFLKRTVPARFWTNPMDNTARPFKLRDLSGAIRILIAGWGLSLIAFLVELLYFNCCRIFKKQQCNLDRDLDRQYRMKSLPHISLWR